MTEEKKDFYPDQTFIPYENNDGMETQLPPEALEKIKQGIEKATSKTVEQQDGDTASQQAGKPEQTQTAIKPKYPSNVLCRCKMKFFFQNGTEYQNEINVPMSKIEMIQQQMASSLENKDNTAVIYLEGSKNCEADFTVIPVRNILYVKFEVEERRM